MAATYASEPLSLLTADYEQFLSTYHSLTDFATSDLWGFSAYGLDHLPLPSMPTSEVAPVGTLVWPTGMSRCAFGHYVVGSTQLADIRTALGTGSAGPANLVLSDGTGNELTFSLYVAAVRPLSQITNQTQAYLLTLCDQRYWLREKTGSITSTPASWGDLLSSLASQLGITLTVDTIDSDYGAPSDRWVFYDKPLSVVLDAAVAAVGHRLVANVDGTFATQSYTTASAAADAQTGATAFRKTAGGLLVEGDLIRSVPASVVVHFPSTVGGLHQADPYTVTTTLASLALSEYGSATGVASQQATFTGELVYNGSNAAACTAYAAQAATDYYKWHLIDLDFTCPGVTEWTPTAAEDRVEWVYEVERILTRVVRRPFQTLCRGGWEAGPNSAGGSSSSTSVPLVRVTALTVGGGEFSRRYTVKQVEIVDSGSNRNAADVSPTTTYSDVVELSNSLVPVSVDADPLQGVYPLHTAPDGHWYIIADEANYFPSGSGATSGSGDDFGGSPRRLVGYTEQVRCEEYNLSVYRVPVYQFGNGLITLATDEEEWDRYENCLSGGGSNPSILCVEPILTNDPIPVEDFGLTTPSEDSNLIWDFSEGTWAWVAASGGSGTVTSVNLTAPAAGITVSGGPITTSGAFTLALADDLAALEGMSGTGLVARTALNTYAQRTITGTASQVTVVNGDGVSGNPTLSLPSTINVDTSGNAATATALATSRNIGGVAFNGTDDIIPQTITSANEGSDSTCFPLFFTASGTQSLQPKNNASFTYNSSTNALGVTTIELGHASDTTIARSSAGNISIEGNVVYRAGGTKVALPDGGTNADLSATGPGVLRQLTAGANVTCGQALDYILLRDEKTAGTEGGTSSTGTNTRTLNTEVVDTGGHCSLASNQFTLSAGTYRIHALVPAYRTARTQAYLYNATAGAAVADCESQPAYLDALYNVYGVLSIKGRFTVAASQALEIRQYVQSGLATQGLGLYGNAGLTEIYTQVELWKEIV